MFNKKVNYFRAFSVFVLAASLVACGGSGSNFTITPLTTAQKQTIAKLATESTDIFELIDAIITATSNIGSITQGALACPGGGSATRTVVNNGSLTTFDNGDSILLSGANCVEADGDTINGDFSIVGTATGSTTTFANVGLSGASINGTIKVAPSNNYDPASGTGSVQIDIDQLVGISGGVSITLQNGSYNLTLAGSNYTYTADHEITSSSFTGTVKAKTDDAGFTGTTSIVSNEFIVSNPLAGTMTITLPDASTATVDANSGSAATYNLTVDSTTTTVLW